MDGLYCLQKVRDAAKELLDVVEVTQAQEQDLSVVISCWPLTELCRFFLGR
jgi:predicted alpha-1,6-mannanase (GH76 family)